MLCYRLAQQISQKIAAIGTVAGTMPEFQQPDRPLPVMHFHGTADSYVPFQGGVGQKSLTRIDFRSVRESIDWWVRLNECQQPPKIERLPEIVADGTRVIRESHLDAGRQERVVLYTIEGGGHTWPGHRWPGHRWPGIV